MKKIYFCIGIIFCFLIIPSIMYSVTLSTEKVGFLDLERIFNEYPSTLKAKEDIKQKKELFNKNVNLQKQEIKDLSENYEVLISSISYYKSLRDTKQIETEKLEVDISTSTQHIVSESTAPISMTEQIDYAQIIEDMDAEAENINNEIIKKQKELDNYIEKIEEQISILEENYSYNLLGEIYDIIVEVASEQGCAVVIDRNMILYGEDLSDLTPFVLEKLRQ